MSFNHLLDSSGVDSFGIPSSTVRSYAKSPETYENLGQRQHYNSPYVYSPSSYGHPSYSPPSYSHHSYSPQKTQVEVPFIDGDVGYQPHSAVQTLGLAFRTPQDTGYGAPYSSTDEVYGHTSWPAERPGLPQTPRTTRKVGSIWAGLAR